MDIPTQKNLLVTRRATLVGHLAEVEHALDEPPSKDWEDRSSERQGDEVLETLGQTEQTELRRIEAALGRIEAGTYGYCQKCGETVSDARLDLLPDTPFCKNCAV